MNRIRRIRLLIQCVGDPLRGDDAAGPLVAAKLREQSLPGDVRLREYWGEGTELLQDWDEAPEVVLVDAARSGVPAGTLHRIDPSSAPLPRHLCYRGSHEFGVAQAVETARALDRLPRCLRLYAIEGADFRPGAEPSRAVAETAARLAGEIALLTQRTGASDA